MLRNSKQSSSYLNADSESSFEFTTEEIQLSLGPTPCIRPASSFKLTDDLKKSFNLHSATMPNSFKTNFSLPDNMFSSAVAPINMLKNFPEQVDFSELLSFDSHLTKQTAFEEQSGAIGDQNVSELYFIENIDRGVEELQKVFGGDNNETKVEVQPSSGLFNGLLRKKSLSTLSMKRFFVDDERMKIELSPQDFSKSRLLNTKKHQLDLQSIISAPTSSIYITPKSGLPFICQEESSYKNKTSSSLKQQRSKSFEDPTNDHEQDNVEEERTYIG